ncbi:UvrD-helicase domain-containing protein [Motilibacter deserti]|uniref:RecBCD enzyme subunit RecB n=1 Tax=Motilibacter deserti TaxID=2714956 RepID=A0ABX0GZ42_9ACTN|nr:UvrD-helicase domain-containing protein [Motilibacter deserti]
MQIAADGPPPFDVCGPLPTGTTVLEASAGTGKTFTLAALATRFLAEGEARLDELMLVTFSRAATQELRERVRERVAAAERGLADPVAARAGDDPVLALLATGSEEEVQARRRRLTVALAGFDAATIATTHQFCQQVLTSLGVAGDTDPDAVLVDSIDDLVVEAVDDLYLRKYAAAGADRPAFPRRTALEVGMAAVYDGQARLEPTDAVPGSEASERYGLAGAVRREVEVRKRRQRLLGYDDLLTRLADALEHDAGGGGAAQARLRARYRVVMVDEFQDTDPVQWKILRLAFHGHATLVLIGDPKQAVYAFRGADVVTYLDAVHDATDRATLGLNWRTDEPLLQALDTLLRGAALGDEGIRVRPVRSAHPGSRLVSAPAPAPLRLRVVGRRGLPLVRNGVAQTSAVRELVTADLAADVVRLLSAPGRLRDGDAERDVQPGDLAVLVRTNSQGALVRDALRAAGVPAVLGGGPSVFSTSAARDWLVLLEALEQPHRAWRAHAAALTSLLGWTPEQLDAGGDGAADELGPVLRGWAQVLATRGMAALAETVFAVQHVPERLLVTTDGERILTDLRHVAQALHAAAQRGQLGLPALVEELRRRIADAATDTDEERTRRLESDAAAVQVVTIHRSKGLEFPIVYVPFGWDRWVPSTPDPLRLHDDDGERVLDVGGRSGPGWGRRRVRHAEEEAGEDLRLLYVALTRARSQAVLWWAPSSNTPSAALHRLLFGGFGPGDQPPDTVGVPTDAEAVGRLRERLHPAGANVSLEPAERVAEQPRWSPPRPLPASLKAASFDRALDTAWRRTSYSALTAAVHAGPAGHPLDKVGSEAEAPEKDDEPVVPPPDADTTAEHAHAEARLRAMPSPLAALPSGTAFGTLVHAVLERFDSTVPDLEAELRRLSAEQLAVRPVRGLDAATLAAALLPVVRTPLGPLAAGLRLADVHPGDRLPELDFELPLAGGDRPAAQVALGDVAALLRRRLPAHDVLAAYPALLDAPELRAQPLRGFLTGSIDSVLRVHGPAGPRFVVVDYKTNWLGGFGPDAPELSAWDYRPEAMAAAMCAAHYPLQALLYSVALHRFLRWRQPGYAPEAHLGGTLYLFLRGMCGPDTPVVDGQVCGVLGWQPSARLVTELSDLLDGGSEVQR